MMKNGKIKSRNEKSMSKNDKTMWRTPNKTRGC
jgi:hypothetical protein